MTGTIRIIIIGIISGGATLKAWQYWEHSVVDTLLTAYVVMVLLSLLFFSGEEKA